MKKTTNILVLMILLTSNSLSAQTKIGITGGVAVANVKAKYHEISITPKTHTGFTGGLFADIPLSLNFSFQPALNFVQKGFSNKDETSTDNTDKISYNYLEVPLNFVYHNMGFFVGAGPSMSVGLSGKEKFTDKSTPSNSFETKIKFGSGVDEIKRLELGANVLAGYKFATGLLFSFNYNLGLSNIQNGDGSDAGTIKNRYFAVKIGYEFSGAKKK